MFNRTLELFYLKKTAFQGSYDAFLSMMVITETLADYKKNVTCKRKLCYLQNKRFKFRILKFGNKLAAYNETNVVTLVDHRTD